jgi:citrate lyase subunit gamma (acyl carrier protein)
MQKNANKVLIQSGTAGFDEKNDILVTVAPGQAGQGITVKLVSPVKLQYGKQMEKVIRETVQEAGFSDVTVDAIDKSAWDYTIKARVLGALERGMKK